MTKSAYIHIPFCKSKCKYCSFISFPNEDKIVVYVFSLLKDIDVPLNDKHVIIVEDIIDTGLTLTYLKEMFSSRNPLSLKICSAFDKPSRRLVDLKAEYQGIVIPDKYVVGYGLDYDGILRNLHDLYILNEKVIDK